MKTPFFEKAIASLVLVSFLVSAPLYAGAGNSPNAAGRGTGNIANNNRPDHNLGDTFTGKKLERIKASVKGKNGYRILIRSNDDPASIENFFRAEDKEIWVKKVGASAYLVKLPVGTAGFPQERSKLDSGILPVQIGSYEVVQPEVFEALGTGYLSGEATDKLWGMNQVGVPAFAEELSQKPKVKVGVLDTGIDSTHSDLSGNYNTSLSYDFVNEASGSTDDNGHGTEVAGVIGAQVNGAGVFGSNPSADIVSLKVLDANGIGTTYDVLEALAYAKDQHIPVLNVSFGAPADPATDPASNPVCQAITDAKNQGVIAVVSAGNAGVDAGNTIPAACPDAVTVGAITPDNTKTPFSNYGNTVDVYAPGTDIYTTTRNNAYATVNGTSFSAPLVAGLVAKELAYDGTITYDQLLSDIANNYHLVTNTTLASAGITGPTGTASSGTTLSGSTSSGSFQAPVIDYSTYHYYSGTFVQNGTTYGNSLYPDSLGFQSMKLSGVQVYTYDEYMNLPKTNTGTFKALSVPTNGLVGEWLLNGNANDTSGNGNNGTASNVSWVSTNTWNQTQAASFNGSNSVITIPNSSVLNPTAISVSFLYKPIALANNSGIVGKWSYQPDSNGANQWTIYQNVDGKIRFALNAGTITEIVSTTIVSDVSRTYKIDVTYDGTYMRMYIDNVNETSSPKTGNIVPGTQRIEIGSYSSTYGMDTYVNGNIQWLRIYNRALSSSEIQALYNEWTISNNTQTSTPLSPTNQVLSNPLAKYDFRDPSSQMCISNTKQQSNTTITADKNTQNQWDPVTLSKGEFAYDNTLMSIPGKKMPFEFKLSYKNQLYYNGPAGINWDHNYNQYLTGETNGNVLYYNGRLWVFRFTQSGGVFDYNPGLKANLSLSGSVYTISYDNGDKYVFHSTASGASANKLSRIEDANGNSLNFAYSGGLLSAVTDTLGRNISYSYYDHNRLKDVTDFNGRKVTIAYFTGSTASGSLYDLRNVTIDNGTGATKAIAFEYSTGWTDTTNHNITRLIDAKGQTYVTNAYDSGDRVSSQVYGSGTIGYAYTLSGSSITKNTVTDKLGNKTEYTYDMNGNQTQVKYFNPAQTSSVVYNYEYDSAGYMTKETKPRGNGFTYTYDSAGNMTEKRMKADTTAANSSNDLVSSYTYNSRGQVLTETRPNGVVVTNTYDSTGNILTKTVSGIASHSGSTSSATTSYSYLSGGFLDTITDGEGSITKFQYSSGQVSKIIRGTGSITSTGSFVYDSYGNPTSSTDGEGFTKTFAYNAFNLLSTGTTSEGVVTVYEYDANNNKTREVRYLSWGIAVNSYFYYDLLDHLTGSLVDTASGKTLLTTFKYDENGNVTEKKVGSGALHQYTYNEFGKVASERIIMNPSDSSQDIVTGYTYDTNGNLVAKVDPLGNTTAYTYDLYDRVDKETNPKGTYTTLVYDKDGSVNTKSVYSSGNVVLSKSAYLYDGIGNVVKSTEYLDPVNTAQWIQIKIVYDRNGKKTSIIDPKGNITGNTYDGLGRLSSTVDALGNTVSYSYDKRDLVTSKTVTPNTGTGTVTTASAYDHDGRLTSETDNLSQTKSLVYDNLGGIIRSTDEAGHSTDYERNYLGKVTKETKYLSGGTAVVTQYAYDERGNLVSVKDPKNNETVYAYDGIDRNTSVTYADGKQLVYTYDKNSNLTSQTDLNGSVVTNSYDTTNLLSGRSVATGTGVLGVTSEGYGYDSLGRAVSGTDNNGNALAFGYDSLGRLSSEAQTLSGQSASTVSYDYDANGNRTSIASGTGYLANYAYDTLNRLTSVSYNSGSVASYAYTGVLNTGISYGNGVNTVQTFDGLLRLSSLAHSNGSGTIVSRTYGYDPVGNITSDGQKSYAYDTIDRLLSATSLSGVTIPNGSEVFGYDIAGNRSSSAFSGVSQSYSANILNQYLSVTSSGSSTGSVAYSYDNNGNVISNGVLSFGYDSKNRLVKVSSGSTIVSEYQYDVLGRRIQKKVWVETTAYVYSDKNILTETRTNGSKTFKKTYINGLGVDDLIAYDNEEVSLSPDEKAELSFCTNQVLSASGSFVKYGWSAIVDRCNALGNSGTVLVTNRYYFQKDHLGSVIWLTNSSWSLVAEYKYDVYGTAYARAGTGAFEKISVVGSLYDNERLFTGREYDSTIGLYYYRARYYDPVVGRFISRDPIGQTDDVNVYGYVGNSPLMGTDPSGMVVEKKNAKDQKDLFEKYKKAASEDIKNSWSPFIRSSYRSVSCNLDNIKCNDEWKDVAYDKNLWTPAADEWEWLAVIIDWKEVPLDKVWNYFVWYNWRYGWRTLNDPQWNPFKDIYQTGRYVEKYGDKYEWGWWEFVYSFRSDEEVENDEKQDRPWYDKWYADANAEICNSKKVIKSSAVH